jgi:very-short-patch-repair endonuclease
MPEVSFKNMTPEERREYLREIARRGGKTRAKAFTPAYQRATRAQVSSAACRRNGAKGAARTVELHGHQKLFDGSRRKRLEKPSPLELTMIGLLTRLGMEFEREYRLPDTLYTLDFFLTNFQTGIEVDGPLHDPGKPGADKRKVCEARKAEICERLNIRLIRIHHTELSGADLGGVITKINEIAGQGDLPAIGRSESLPTG